MLTTYNIDDIRTRSTAGFIKNFVASDGRVLRPGDDNDTVSEGQAYAMLRAVWIDDQQLFDACYAWTEQKLSRASLTGDHLLAWHWKKGRVQDRNSAADADEDYALALLLAAQRWRTPRRPDLPAYADKARLVLQDILNLETYCSASGRLFLLPGTWDFAGTGIIINPSYLAPAWYRLFYGFSQDSRWLELISSSYDIIEKLSAGMDDIPGAGLVPDWCRLGPDDSLASDPGFSKKYGWDAFRTPWRLFLDWQWHKEPRAGEYLRRLHVFYQSEWKSNGRKIVAEYAYNGRRLVDHESPAMYVPFLACCLYAAPESAPLPLEKIIKSFNAQTGCFVSQQAYYENCWAFFGLILPDLTKPLP